MVIEGSSSASLLSAWPSLTSSLRSLAEIAMASTGAIGLDLGDRRMRPACRR